MIVLLNINKKLHKDMIESIAGSLLSYFDVNEVGTVLNKFSNDLGVLDISLPKKILWVVTGIAVFLVMFVSAAEMNPLFLVFMALCGIVFFLIYTLTAKMIVGSKRCDFQAKEPIFKQLEEIGDGIIQTRLFTTF